MKLAVLLIAILSLSACAPFHLEASISYGEGQVVSKATNVEHTRVATFSEQAKDTGLADFNPAALIPLFSREDGSEADVVVVPPVRATMGPVLPYRATRPKIVIPPVSPDPVLPEPQGS